MHLAIHNATVAELNLNTLFTADDPHVRINHGQRSHAQSVGMRRVQDAFEGADCLFLRADTALRLRLDGNYALQRCAAGGWLLHSRDSAAPSYWFPILATLRRNSAQGHILEELSAEWESFDLDSSGVAISFIAIPEGWALDAVIWKLDDPVLIKELMEFSHVETQGYFLLGSHTRYGKPADLYRHLINGWVYEDRYAWPFKRKICSENDAHALHLVFSGLERANHKRIYVLLKAQLLLSVLSRQGEDGGFRHGEWTDKMESHYRLHCSAMHLLMDTLDESDDPVVRQALKKAAAFVSKQRDETRIGNWFLHDGLEHSIETMQRSPFRWVPGRTLGKSSSNTLVLNTHIDTTIALSRYFDMTLDNQYESLIASANEATKAILAMRTAEWFYRPLFWIISLSLLPTSVAKDLPLPLRALKRVGWKYLVPLLPNIKSRLPRLVMPGGYIDRAISVGTLSDTYLAINAMDLARWLRRFPNDSIKAMLDTALTYGTKWDLLKRWAEVPSKAYALGFWAEALYHLCLLDPSPRYRKLLAETMLELELNKGGVPVSLLGGNSEAIQLLEQLPCPSPADPCLRVANLGRANRVELLVVNPTDTPRTLNWESGDIPYMPWYSNNNDEFMQNEVMTVPTRGWLWGCTEGFAK